MSSAQSRAERWLDRRIEKARTPRGAAIVIAVVTTTITIGSGLLMRVVDHKQFTTVGQGLWWAVQTVTTVGYGDHVPTSPAGQILAALVMLLGIGFVTIITASITSTFVERERAQHLPRYLPTEQLQDIVERLERIEKSMGKEQTGDD